MVGNVTFFGMLVMVKLGCFSGEKLLMERTRIAAQNLTPMRHVMQYRRKNDDRFSYIPFHRVLCGLYDQCKGFQFYTHRETDNCLRGVGYGLGIVVAFRYFGNDRFQH